MHDAVQDSALHVAERDGSSSVHERVDCADPVQPRFRRVEHAFGCLGRYHGVERREEERTESGHGHGGTDGTHAGHCDRPGRATGCGKGSIGTEGRYRIGDGSQRNYRARRRDAKSCPCHDGTREEYRSDREASGTGRKGKGIGEVSRIRDVGEARIRNSKEAARARDPREAFRDSRGDLRAGGGIPNESLEQLASSTRPERRRKENQESSPAAGAATAASGGSGPGQAASSPKRAIPAAVVDRIEGRSGAIAPKRGPRPEASESRVKKEFIEIKPSRGVTMVSLTASEASDVGDMEEVPESAPASSEAPRSRQSSGLTGAERVTSETIIRIGATPEGEVVAKKQDIKPGGTAFFMKRRPQEKEKVKFTSQVRSLMRPADNSALSMTDASTSEWMSGTAQNEDPPVLELTEENLKRLDESVKQRRSPSILPIKAKSRPIGPQPPPGPPPGWQPPAKQPPVPPPKQPPVPGPVMTPTNPANVKPEEVSETAKVKPEEVPEPKTPPVPEPKTPPASKPKAKSRPLTEEQKAVAEENLAQKAQEMLRKAERGTATLKREKESSASGSGAKKVPKYLEHLTDDQRAHLFRTELSSEREAEAIEWEKELARREKEEEERRKAKALYRSEKMAQALEHGKEIQRRRQEEFEKGKQDLLQWRAEEEDRENLSKARRISLEQTSVPPASGGVILTPAPTAALGENPSTPPEALQAPLSEEEIAYRKELQEHLSKFSDKREDAK